MMCRLSWLWHKKEDPACDDRLAKAQQRVEDLDRRATHAATILDSRLKRNHWGETIAEITRRER